MNLKKRLTEISGRQLEKTFLKCYKEYLDDMEAWKHDCEKDFIKNLHDKLNINIKFYDLCSL